MPTDSLAKLIAFYLPQFHPIPENDQYWGRGFTEWTNVAKARPLYKRHYQPQLPADLGFYDLRLPESRQAQADLAREYGIYGFCYYHYWFHGRQLLQRPFDEVLTSGQPDFPFCLCWANEPWSRRWDGMDKEIIVEQSYSDEDDLAHIAWLSTAFRDNRYIRIDGKPLLLIYRATALPNALRTTTLWRDAARRSGIGELYLCKVESFFDDRTPPQQGGFDASVEFQPDNKRLPQPTFQQKLWYLARPFLPPFLREASYERLAFDFEDTVKRMTQHQDLAYKRFPCVMPSWDNTARRSNGPTVFKNATPEAYERWLRAIIAQHASDSEQNVIFLNAWNEWAEGNHLEPCQKWGRAYLEATRRAVEAPNTGDQIVPISGEQALLKSSVG